MKNARTPHIRLAAARPREGSAPSLPANVIVLHRGGFAHAAEPYDETEGVSEFFGDIETWLNGFGFGVFAGTLAIAIGATLWAWLS